MRRPAVRAAGAALGAFVLVACLDEPTPLDRRAYEWARRNHDSFFELLQRPLEVFGLPGIHIPLALLLARKLRQRGRHGSMTIAAGAFAGWTALRVSRLIIHRPRPPRPPGRRPKSESTFPSGHTTETTCLSVVTAVVLRNEQILTARQALLLGISLPLVMGAGRVYVREHWVTDVLGGWALGLSAAMLVLGVAS